MNVEREKGEEGEEEEEEILKEREKGSAASLALDGEVEAAAVLLLGLVFRIAYEGRRETEPTAPLVSVSRGAAGSRPGPDAPVAAGRVDGRGASSTASTSTSTSSSTASTAPRRLAVPLSPGALLDQLAGDDAKHLVDALAVLAADLVAAVPADVLGPEPAVPLAVWRHTPTVVVDVVIVVIVAVVVGAADARARGRRRCLGRVQLLGDVGDGTLKGHPSTGRVVRHDIRLGADDVDDQPVRGLTVSSTASSTAEILLELEQPAAHLVKGALVGDVVAEQPRVGAAVVEARDAAEALLAGGVPYLQPHDGVRGRVEHPLGDERGPDGRRGRRRAERVADVALHQAGLPDSCSPSVSQ